MSVDLTKSEFRDSAVTHKFKGEMQVLGSAVEGEGTLEVKTFSEILCSIRNTCKLSDELRIF